MLSGRANIKKGRKADVCWAVREEQQDRQPGSLCREMGCMGREEIKGKVGRQDMEGFISQCKDFLLFWVDGDALKGFGKRGISNWLVFHIISQDVQNRWNMLKTKFSLFPSKPPTFSASPTSDSSMLKTSVIFCISKPIVTKPCQFSLWNVFCICLLYPFPLSKSYQDLTDFPTFFLLTTSTTQCRQNDHPNKADHS